MPRTCTICQHDQRAEIEAALLNGRVFRKISETFSLSITALHRHKNEHMITAVARNQVVNEEEGTARFQRRFVELRQKVDDRLTKAETANDDDLIVKYLREARGLLDLEAKVVLQILGLKSEGNETIAEEDMQRFLSTILTTLRPYPAALAAVQEVMQ